MPVRRRRDTIDQPLTETQQTGHVTHPWVAVSGDGKSVSNKRLFTDFMVDGVHCGPDDMTVDVDGNLYFSSNAPLGYSGVTVYNPAGKLIGRIRLPEVCANLQFGGPKHNFLLMTASQSLYALQLNTQGAHPGN